MNHEINNEKNVLNILLYFFFMFIYFQEKQNILIVNYNVESLTLTI